MPCHFVADGYERWQRALAARGAVPVVPPRTWRAWWRDLFKTTPLF